MGETGIYFFSSRWKARAPCAAAGAWAEVLEVVLVVFVLVWRPPLSMAKCHQRVQEHQCLGCLPGEPPALSGGTCWRWVTRQRECGGLITGQNCHSHPEGFPGGFLLLEWFPAASKHVPFPSPVPGGIASESLTFTPLEDMIFLKWEEPVEPNGLITQYEVRPGQRGTRGTRGHGTGPLRGVGGVWDNLCCWPWGLEAAAAAPEPFGFSSEPLLLFHLRKSLSASRLPRDHPLL